MGDGNLLKILYDNGSKSVLGLICKIAVLYALTKKGSEVISTLRYGIILISFPSSCEFPKLMPTWTRNFC